MQKLDTYMKALKTDRIRQRLNHLNKVKSILKALKGISEEQKNIFLAEKPINNQRRKKKRSLLPLSRLNNNSSLRAISH